MPTSPDYVSPEFLRLIASAMPSWKAATYEHVQQLQAGQKVLDLGCGPGVDTVALAQRLEDGVGIYGLDLDEDMIALADDAAVAARVAHRVQHHPGSADVIPFPDASFDAVRAEKLFQVVGDEETRREIYDEVVRVLAPDGVAVLIDLDFGTLSIDFSDRRLERRLIEFFTFDVRSNGFAGRNLKAGLLDAGFMDVSVTCHTRVFDAFSTMPFLGSDFVARAVAAGVVSQPEADRWIAELTERSERGAFFATITGVVATGRMPCLERRLTRSVRSA